MGDIQMIGKSQAEMFRGEKPGETKLVPNCAARRRSRCSACSAYSLRSPTPSGSVITCCNDSAGPFLGMPLRTVGGAAPVRAEDGMSCRVTDSWS